MDIFKILSRGTSLKKSNPVSSGFRGDKPKKHNVTKQVEKETDFFHTRRHEPEVKEENESEEEDIPPQITTAEEAARLRKRSKANVTGQDIPLPIGSFHDLVSRFSLDKKLLRNLIEADFTEPTAIQSECIPISLFNRDLIACAPTGSGKSLAYLIPLVQQIQEASDKGLSGLVICPTNELASQLSQELGKLLRGKKISATILSKSLAAKLKNKAVSSSKFNLLVTTPLRLIEVVKQGALNLSHVQHIVFDEADKLFEEGFLKQTDVILSECTNPSLQKSMFSATIPSGVEEMAHSIMSSPIRVIIGHKEAASSTIHQKLVYTGNEQGKLLAIRQMIQNSEFKPPVIIFLQSITRAKALFHELLYDRLNVDMIHAERTPAQREEAIENFKKGKVWVLICTDVLARGIDFKGVNLVINYDVPQSAQAYVHRIGRTGRAGRDGRAVTFFTKEDSVGVKSVINVMKQSESHEGVSEWMESLGKVTQREKKQLKKSPVDRKSISTVPGIDRKKRRMRKEMVEASKKRKSEESIAEDGEA